MTSKEKRNCASLTILFGFGVLETGMIAATTTGIVQVAVAGRVYPQRWAPKVIRSASDRCPLMLHENTGGTMNARNHHCVSRKCLSSINRSAVVGP